MCFGTFGTFNPTRPTQALFRARCVLKALINKAFEVFGAMFAHLAHLVFNFLILIKVNQSFL